MSRIPLSTDLKTRTGAPDKDARLKNCYVEVRGESSAVRRRPSAQGGVAVGSGTAQGGIGFNIAGTDYFIGVWGDTITPYTGGGTTWNSGTAYSIGDHVSVGFVDYWADQSNTNVEPENNLDENSSPNGIASGLGVWSKTYKPPSTLDYSALTYTTSNAGISDIYVPVPPIFPTITRTTTNWFDWQLKQGAESINNGHSTLESFHNYQAGSYAQYQLYDNYVMTQTSAVSLASSWGISPPPPDSYVAFSGRETALTFDAFGNILTFSHEGSFTGLIK